VSAVDAYKKERRRLQKEAYKSESNYIKVRETLAATQTHLKAVKGTLETEQRKSAKYEQDAFTAQYQLVGTQEDLHKAREQITVLEQERDTLKTSLKEEEVARIAAEGLIALPPAKDDDDDLLRSPAKSPIKSPRKHMARRLSDSEKENIAPPKKTQMQLKSLQDELSNERRLRQQALDQIDFMKMECQFQCCSCRVAEKQGKAYVHDGRFLAEMERIKREVPVPEDNMEVDAQNPVEAELDATVIKQEVVEVAMEIDITFATPEPMEQDEAPEELQEIQDAQDVEESHDETVPEPAEDHLQVTVSKNSRRESSLRLSGSVQRSTPDVEDTFATQPSEPSRYATPEAESQPDPESDQESEHESEHGSEHGSEAEEVPQPETQHPEKYITPSPIAIRTITTTTTIPMQFSPVKASVPYHLTTPSTPATISHSHFRDENMPPTTPGGTSVFKADGTMDRALALEQINQRRMRAQSMQMGKTTPGRQMVVGRERRDLSAPQMRKR